MIKLRKPLRIPSERLFFTNFFSGVSSQESSGISEREEKKNR